MNDKKQWHTGLFSCTNSTGNCCFCCLSAFCPSIGYGLNYNLATQKSCCIPCILHFCCDGLVSSITQGLFQLNAALNLPLGCILRVNHRQFFAGFDATTDDDTADNKHRETLLSSLILEIFCWSCSLAQVRREIHFCKTEIPDCLIEGDPYTGAFHSMQEDSSATVLVSKRQYI